MFIMLINLGNYNKINNLFHFKNIINIYTFLKCYERFKIIINWLIFIFIIQNKNKLIYFD
jgi:hypothetical protein